MDSSSSPAKRIAFTSMALVRLDADIMTGRFHQWSLRRIGELIGQLPRTQLVAFDRQLKRGKDIKVALIAARRQPVRPASSARSLPVVLHRDARPA